MRILFNFLEILSYFWYFIGSPCVESHANGGFWDFTRSYWAFN